MDGNGWATLGWEVKDHPQKAYPNNPRSSKPTLHRLFQHQHLGFPTEDQEFHSVVQQMCHLGYAQLTAGSWDKPWQTQVPLTPNTASHGQKRTLSSITITITIIYPDTTSISFNYNILYIYIHNTYIYIVIVVWHTITTSFNPLESRITTIGSPHVFQHRFQFCLDLCWFSR